MTAHVFSLQRSNGGVPKLPIATATVTVDGVDGDRQRNLKHHGGPDRALCLYALERIVELQREGHPVYPGALGENVTIAGLDWDRVQIGAVLSLGAVVVEITAFAPPCRTIAHVFSDGRYGRISDKTAPGWSRAYARVLTPGTIAVADAVSLRDGG